MGGGRHKVADNYLSLKAYAATGKDAITDYMKKSKRSGLSSIGDLLVTVGRLSDVKVSKSEGVGAGAKSLPAIFGAKNVKAKNAVSSINFLVNEYTRTLTSVQQRWPMGLASTCSPRSRPTCRSLAFSKWTASQASPRTSCLSMPNKLVCPPSCPTLLVLLSR